MMYTHFVQLPVDIWVISFFLAIMKKLILLFPCRPHHQVVLRTETKGLCTKLPPQSFFLFLSRQILTKLLNYPRWLELVTLLPQPPRVLYVPPGPTHTGFDHKFLFFVDKYPGVGMVGVYLILQVNAQLFPK